MKVTLRREVELNGTADLSPRRPRAWDATTVWVVRGGLPPHDSNEDVHATIM